MLKFMNSFRPYNNPFTLGDDYTSQLKLNYTGLSLGNNTEGTWALDLTVKPHNYSL